MIVSEIITKIRHLRVAEECTGTGFLTEQNGCVCLVTARHLVQHLMRGDAIEIQRNGNWEPVVIQEIAHDPKLDVSVIVTQLPLGVILNSVDLSMERIIYGQDVYFLGFPHGWFGDVGTLLSGYPLPFVKRALVSNLTGGGDKEFYLDGINNPGFSGGPVVFKNSASGSWQIGGVISGYRYIEQDVIGSKNAELKYEVNTGIVVASPINSAVSLIRELTASLA